MRSVRLRCILVDDGTGMETRWEWRRMGNKNEIQNWGEQLSWVELATMTMTMMMRRIAADIANCGNYLCVSCGNSEWKWPTNCQVKWSNIAESWAEAAKVSARCVCTSMYRSEQDRQKSVVLGSRKESNSKGRVKGRVLRHGEGVHSVRCGHVCKCQAEKAEWERIKSASLSL